MDVNIIEGVLKVNDIKMCDEDVKLEDTCVLCNKMLTNGVPCTDHDDKVKQYECLYCDLNFSRQASLVWHLKTAHDYKLDTNSKKSPSGSEHNYYERPKCMKCNVELLNAYELEKHVCGSFKLEQSTQGNKLAESPVTQHSEANEAVESPVTQANKVKKPVESSETQTNKVKKLVKSPVTQSNKVKKLVESPVTQSSKVKKLVESPVTQSSKVKKLVESPVTQSSKLKKLVESPVTQSNKVKKLVESPVTQSNKVMKLVESPVTQSSKVRKQVESPVTQPTKEAAKSPVTQPSKVKEAAESPVTQTVKGRKPVESPMAQTRKPKEAAKSPVTHSSKAKKAPVIHCSTCNKDFTSDGEYHKHLSKYATRYRPFFCCICQTTFSRKRSLIFHLYIHKRSSEPESKVSRLSDIAVPPRAYPYVSPPKTIKTPEKQEVKSASLKKAKKEVETDGPARKSARISTETSSKPVPKDEPQIIDVRNNAVSNQKCTMCKKKFKKVLDLETHMIKDHQAPLMHQCSLCSEAFVLKPSLLNHAIGHIF